MYYSYILAIYIYIYIYIYKEREREREMLGSNYTWLSNITLINIF